MCGKIDHCCRRTVNLRQDESTLVTGTWAPTHINPHLLGIQTNTFPLTVTAFRWDPYLCHTEKWNANWQRSRLCVAGFSLEAPLKAAPAVMFTVGLAEPWQLLEAGRETLRKCLQPLLTALPAHSGSLITEALAYCPCLLLMLQAWCCFIHTASASWKNSCRSCRRVQRANVAQFRFAWMCQRFRDTLYKGQSQEQFQMLNLDPDSPRLYRWIHR